MYTAQYERGLNKQIGDLFGICWRRINLQHCLIHQVSENGRIIKILRCRRITHNDQTKETVVIRYTFTACNKTLILYYNSVQMIDPDSRLNLNSWTLQTSKVICNPSARKHAQHRD